MGQLQGLDRAGSGGAIGHRGDRAGERMIGAGRADRFADPLHQAVKTVAGLNLIYFGIEFAVALAIGSVSLFADSIDFLEDAAVNGLILIALGWSARRRALVGMAMAAILLVPGAATACMAWAKFILPV